MGLKNIAPSVSGFCLALGMAISPSSGAKNVTRDTSQRAVQTIIKPAHCTRAGWKEYFTQVYENTSFEDIVKRHMHIFEGNARPITLSILSSFSRGPDTKEAYIHFLGRTYEAIMSIEYPDGEIKEIQGFIFANFQLDRRSTEQCIRKV